MSKSSNNSDSKDYVLSRISSAEIMLREASEPKQAIEIADIAEAARIYAKRAHAAIPVINHATSIKIRAERKAGELLRGMEKAKGNQFARSRDATKLTSLGISKSQSSRWQKTAAVTEEEIQDYVRNANEQGKEITTAGVYKLADQKRSEGKPQKAKRPARKKKTPLEQLNHWWGKASPDEQAQFRAQL